MNMSELKLSTEELQKIKDIVRIFNAQEIIIDDVKYKINKKKDK